MSKIITFLLIILPSFSLFSQNDLCNNAISLTPTTDCSNLVSGTFSGSSISSAAPGCALSTSQDVWYQFTATDATMSVSVSAVTGTNHGIEIIQNNCSGTSSACINNYGTNVSETYLNNNFVVGQTYFVRVFNVNAVPSVGNFQICLRNYPSPANDLCENVVSITPTPDCSNVVSGTFSGSGISSAAPGCAFSASQDVWYQFTAIDATMGISLFPLAGTNQGFEIIGNNCSGISSACVNNNGTNFGETYLNNNFVVGQTYFVRVFNVNAVLSVGNFQICIQNYPAPANDLCANAVSLTPTTDCSNLVSGTFNGSGINTAAPGCAFSASQDVWYRFIATDATMSVYVSAVNGANHGFEIIGNNCSGTSSACINNNGTNISESYLSNSFVIGQTYFVRVFNTNSNLSLGNFQVCVQNPNLSTDNPVVISSFVTPNPAKESLTIHSDHPIREIFIQDSVGKKLPVIYLTSTTIDVSHLSKGIYLLTIINQDATRSTKKFIKE